MLSDDGASMREQLRMVAEAYLRQASAMSYRELCAHQDAPWASIAFGAGGIAAALARPGRRRGRSREIASARRWLDDATRGSRAQGAFANHHRNGPFYYGNDGIAFVRLRTLAPSDAERDAAIGAFVARARRTRRRSGELLFGVAGYLTALCILSRTTRDRRVLDAADDLAGVLLDESRARGGWMRAEKLGFGHGRAGTFHALLQWSSARGGDLPPHVLDGLETLARDIDSAGTMGAPPASGPRLERSFCNGASGLVLLWARAYERTGDTRYIDRARAAASFALEHVEHTIGDLCCGLGGRAYALLSMDRVEPDRGWFDHALRMGARAVRAMLGGPGAWPNGLYTGYPGLVCLTTDLLSTPRERVGFPLVEG